MKKLFGFIATFSFLIMLLSCADNQARNEVLKMVNEINHSCPIQYDMFTLQKASIQDNNIVLSYTVEENVFHLEVLKNYPEKIKRIGGSSVFSNPEFTNKIINSGYGMTVIFKELDTNQEIKVEVSNEEIKDIVANPASKEEILDWQIESANLTMPQKIDELTSLVKVEKSGDNVVYFCDIDDKDIDFELFYESVNEIKQDLKDNLYEMNSQQSPYKQFFDLLCRTNKNLCYTYRSKTTDQELTVTISNSELRDIFK